MVKIKFSDHRLIKISMMYLYMKLKLKNDKTIMTAAIVKLLLGYCMKIAIWCGEFFWCGNEHLLGAARDSPLIYRISRTSLGKGKEVRIWWRQQAR